MRVAHVNEPALGDPGAATVWIGEHEHASENALAEIEFLPVVVNIGVLEREPRTFTDAKSEVQPVGNVDQVFVGDVPTCNVGDEPIVEPRHVRAGVVHVAGRGLGCGATRREISVAEGAQRLAEWFFQRSRNLRR